MEYEVSGVLTCKLPPHQQDRPGSLSCSVFLISKKKSPFSHSPLSPFPPMPSQPKEPLFSIFLGKSLLAFLFLHQQHGFLHLPAWPPTSLAVYEAVLFLEKGSPHPTKKEKLLSRVVAAKICKEGSTVT